MAGFDLAVIGAGPAGMMAAARAAELGAKVILLEKNLKPGRKLLLTGNGRCNLTAAEFDLASLVEKYGRAGKFLYPAFHRFGPKAVMEFFESRGLPLKIEEGLKVFPKSDRAAEVLKVLYSCLEQGRVEIGSGREVVKLSAEGNRIKSAVTLSGEISAENFLLASGGKSYPKTGSDGKGYQFLRELGHSLAPLRPGLAPLKIREPWVRALKGLSVEKVELGLGQNQKQLAFASGDLMFTHFGLSGPAALDLSGAVAEARARGPAQIRMDFVPTVDQNELEAQLLTAFSAGPNKMVKNHVDRLVPPRLAEALLKLAGITQDKRANALSKSERRKIAALLKNTEVSVAAVLGFDQAMITNGGVELKEIDPNTMKSKLISNLFLAGEILNLHGPSGGYNLQLAWATGYLAGSAAAGLSGFGEKPRLG